MLSFFTGSEFLKSAQLGEPVSAPREIEQFLRYFCGDANDPESLNKTEQLRVSYYKTVATFIRAFADIAQHLTEAGYSDAESTSLENESKFHADIRAAIKKHSGEELDVKPFEADMRHLLNARGKLSKNSVAEGIINNVRKTIIRDQLTDPRFYAEMSKLLDDLIEQRRKETIDYETFLKKVEELVMQLGKKKPVDGVPASLHGHPEAIVLFNNLARILDGDDSMVAEESPADMEERASLALKIDQTIREQAPAGWKDDIDGPRGRQVLNALFPIMNRDRQATQAIFEIIKHQAGY